jgi:glycogen operon protein
VILNAYWEPLAFEVPPREAGVDAWRRIVDTTLASPDDFTAAADAPTIETDTYLAGPRSIVVLAAQRTNATKGSNA